MMIQSHSNASQPRTAGHCAFIISDHTERLYSLRVPTRTRVFHHMHTRTSARDNYYGFICNRFQLPFQYHWPKLSATLWRRQTVRGHAGHNFAVFVLGCRFHQTCESLDSGLGGCVCWTRCTCASYHMIDKSACIYVVNV